MVRSDLSHGEYRYWCPERAVNKFLSFDDAVLSLPRCTFAMVSFNQAALALFVADTFG